MVYKNSQIYNTFILSKPNIINNFVITIYIYQGRKMNISSMPLFSNNQYNYLVIPDELDTVLRCYYHCPKYYSRDPKNTKDFYLLNIEKDLCSLLNDDKDLFDDGMSDSIAKTIPYEYMYDTYTNIDTNKCITNIYDMWQTKISEEKKGYMVNRALSIR
jgi:hypothetical protein